MRPLKLCLTMLAAASLLHAQTLPEEDAEKADDTWLNILDKGDYVGSWQHAAPLLQKQISAKQFAKGVKSARDPLGGVELRTLHDAKVTTQLPGVPDGQYVVAHYDTTFEHKQSAVETVVAAQQADGSWLVSGYFVK